MSNKNESKSSSSGFTSFPTMPTGAGSGEGGAMIILIMLLCSAVFLAYQIKADIQIWYDKKNFTLINVKEMPKGDNIQPNEIYYLENEGKISCCFKNKTGQVVNLDIPLPKKSQNKDNQLSRKLVNGLHGEYNYINVDGHAQLRKICCRILVLAVVLAVVCAFVATTPMGWSLGAGILIAACILLVTASVSRNAEKNFPDDSGISVSLGS